MIVLVVIAILPVTLVNQFYYQRTRSFIEEKVITYNEELVKQSSKQLEAIIAQTQTAQQQLTAYLISPKTLETYASHSAAEKARIVRDTEFDLANIRRSFPAIANIYVVLSNGSFYGTNSLVNRQLLLSQSWFAPELWPARGDFVVPGQPAGYFNINDPRQAPQTISFIRKVIIYEGSNQPRAAIQIDVAYAALEAILAELTLGGQAAISLTDAEGRIIYCATANCLEETTGKAYTIKQAIAGSDLDVEGGHP